MNATDKSTGPDLGPLTSLIGTWEGSKGLDYSFVYATGEQEEVPFRERATFSPAGPAHNGAQSCCRLDYRLAAWRMDESIPFHVEVGYWFWDPEHELVMRGFATPRGIVVLAGGTTKSADKTISIVADEASESYGILSNPYLLTTARTTRFEVTLDLSQAGQYSYDQKTFMYLSRIDGTLCHRDRNTLELVSETPSYPGLEF